MTATTAERIATKFGGLVPGKGTFGIAANTLLLKKTIVTADSNGRAAVPANGQDALGVAKATFDNRTGSAAGGLADDLDAEVEYGVFSFLSSGTDPEPGEVLFVVDNQTVSTDSNGGLRGVAGFCTEPPRDGQVMVYMGPHVSGEIQVGAAVSAIANKAAADDLLLSAHEVPVSLGSFASAAGVPLPAFADGSANGFNLADSEAFGIRINPSGDVALAPIWASCKLPDDLDAAQAVTLHVRAARIGSSDTTVVLTPHVFGNTVGVAYDAGADLVSGNTGAISGATKVVADVTKTITGATAGQNLSISLVPSAALDADDLLILAVYITCHRDLS
jgi:hypothetical protein